MPELDHLVWAAQDADVASEWLEKNTGIRPLDGGQHAGQGTANRLAGLDGVNQYLEVIFPDPEQNHDNPIAQNIKNLKTGGLFHWAVRHSNLNDIHSIALESGVSSSGALQFSRDTPTGERLEWQLLFLGDHGLGGLVPFFIDWGSCPHPSRSLPSIGTISKFELQSPNTSDLEKLLNALDIHVPVAQADRPAIHFEIETPSGTSTLPCCDPFTNGFAL